MSDIEIDQEPADDPYGKSVSRIAIVFAAIGAVGGGAALITQFSTINSFKDAKALFFAPLTLGGAGWFLGFSLALLFAPTAYLKSNNGKKWLDTVGTESIAAARLACAMFALFALFFFGLLVWAALTGQF